MTPVGPVSNLNLNYYELAEDQINDLFYASNTDFFSYGKVYVYDASNNLVTTFDAGVSPGTIAFDVRNAVGMSDLINSFTVYPNPSNGLINIEGVTDADITVYSITGEKLLSVDMMNSSTLDLSELPTGNYFVNIKQNDFTSTVKVILTK
jgi:hypothetical protein